MADPQTFSLDDLLAQTVSGEPPAVLDGPDGQEDELAGQDGELSGADELDELDGDDEAPEGAESDEDEIQGGLDDDGLDDDDLGDGVVAPPPPPRAAAPTRTTKPTMPPPPAIAPAATAELAATPDEDIAIPMMAQTLSEMRHVRIEDLIDAEYNRDLGDILQLVDSIKTAGLLEPLVVCTTAMPDKYLVIAGHRRKAAALQAGLQEVPCVVRKVSTAAERLALMLIENLHRKDMSPLEEARGYQRVLDATPPLPGGQKALSKMVGVSQPIISKRLSLLRLPPEAQQALEGGRVTLEQASDLLRLPPIKVMELMAGTGPVASRDISLAVRSHERAERAAMRRAQLSTKGIKVISAEPNYDADKGPYPVWWLQSAGRLTKEQAGQHGNLPCHAVFVKDDEQEMELCTQPANHPYPEGAKPSVSGTDNKDHLMAAAARRALDVRLAQESLDDTQFDIGLIRACLLYHDPGLADVLNETAASAGGTDLVAQALEGDARANTKAAKSGLHLLALAAAERVVTARKDGSFNTSPPALAATKRYMDYLQASGYTPNWWDRELMEIMDKKPVASASGAAEKDT